MNELQCPALSDLFATPQEEWVARHLADCPRCRVLLKGEENRETPLILQPPQAPMQPALSNAREQNIGIEAGTVALFAVAESEDLLSALILETRAPLMWVAPISSQTKLATEDDLLLPREILGYAAFVALGERSAIRAEQLRETRTNLIDELWVSVGQLLAGEEASEVVGPTVLGEADPRLRWRSALFEEWEPFWRPAAVLGEAASLGELVGERREKLRIDEAAVADLVDRRGWLGRLEAGRLDLSGELPVAALASLFRRLEIPPLEAVLALVRTAITGGEVEVAPQGAVFARRRSGLRGSSFKAGKAEREAIAERYLEHLREALVR